MYWDICWQHKSSILCPPSLWYILIGTLSAFHSLPPRWLEGEHPQEEGETVEVVAFFDFDNNPKYKSVPVSFKISLESGPRLQATEAHGRIYFHQKSSVMCGWLLIFQYSSPLEWWISFCVHIWWLGCIYLAILPAYNSIIQTTG